jgi:hypothetical protein
MAHMVPEADVVVVDMLQNLILAQVDLVEEAIAQAMLVE